MWRIYVVRIHRWLALLFGVPLLAVILSGLILSFEPLVQQTQSRQPITLERVNHLLARYDPQNTARNLSIDTFANVLTVGGDTIDIATGDKADLPRLGSLMLTTRRFHETLLFNLGWLVTASTFAMLAITVLGTLLGWPQFKNSLRGWHQGAAWLTLPLIVLSPLTGLALALGISLAGSPAAGTVSLPLKEAAQLVAGSHDLASLTSIRQRGRTQMARVYVDGELRSFGFAKDKLVPMTRSWTRVIHEGNWGGPFGSLANALVSVVLTGLLATGLIMWLRNSRARDRGRQRRAAVKGAIST